MWGWVLIVAGYSVSLFAFQLLGGIAAAGRAIESWGRSSSARRIARSGGSAKSFADARLGRR